MKTFHSVPQVGLIAGTRAALGAGVALLLADHLTRNQRRAVGWTLLAVGVLSTPPLIARVFGQERRSFDEAFDADEVGRPALPR